MDDGRRLNFVEESDVGELMDAINWNGVLMLCDRDGQTYTLTDKCTRTNTQKHRQTAQLLAERETDRQIDRYREIRRERQTCTQRQRLIDAER